MRQGKFFYPKTSKSRSLSSKVRKETNMVVRKLFLSQNFPAHMVVETEKGVYGKFLAAPARKVQKEDITSLPAYAAKGNNAEEAPDYLYRMYGLKRREGEK